MDIAIISRFGDREKNEDYVDYAEQGEAVCLVLADGLGGHGFGEIASRIAVDTVVELFKQTQVDDIEEDMEGFLVTAVKEAQQALIMAEKKKIMLRNMRTTITVLVGYKNKVQCLHVGDSRVYVLNRKKIIHCTEDHSVPGLLVRSGQLRFSKIRNHPDRSQLLRAMGQEDELRYSISAPMIITDNTGVLLCSDGFWELIVEKQMIKTFGAASNAEQWLLHMEEIVKNKGKDTNMDNYSAIVGVFRCKK